MVAVNHAGYQVEAWFPNIGWVNDFYDDEGNLLIFEHMSEAKLFLKNVSHPTASEFRAYEALTPPVKKLKSPMDYCQ